MPTWQPFVPEDAYTDEEKLDLGDRITSLHPDSFELPRFEVEKKWARENRSSPYAGADQ